MARAKRSTDRMTMSHGLEARDVVKTAHFAKWWGSDELTHVLQRDAGQFQGSSTLDASLTRTSTNNNTRPGTCSSARAAAPSLHSPRPVPGDHQAAPSIATYRGTARSCEVFGLAPNTLYRFALRLVSSRSHSRLSASTEVWTAPGQPSQPACARCEAKAVVLKWYAPAGGAEKYVLESRLVDSLDDAHQRDSGYFTGGHRQSYVQPDKSAVRHRRGDTWHESVPPQQTVTSTCEWKVAYEGRDTAVRVSELQPRAAYRFRVRALNGAGHASQPSQLAQIATCDTDAHVSLSPKRAAEQFTLDTDCDVAVGDTILFTERLHVEKATGALVGQPARGGKLERAPHNRGISQRAAAAQRQHKDSQHRRLNQQLPGGRASCAQRHVGDRTVAAHVLAETWYAVSTASSFRVKERRELRLQVCWCTVSTNEASNFQLAQGDVLQRDAQHITQFEVFRAPWVDEPKRRSHADERRPAAHHRATASHEFIPRPITR